MGWDLAAHASSHSGRFGCGTQAVIDGNLSNSFEEKKFDIPLRSLEPTEFWNGVENIIEKAPEEHRCLYREAVLEDRIASIPKTFRGRSGLGSYFRNQTAHFTRM